MTVVPENPLLEELVAIGRQSDADIDIVQAAILLARLDLPDVERDPYCAHLEDLRAAAAIANGRQAVVPTLVVPGSGLVKKQAEAEGLDKVFKKAGMEWREPGCSMCVAINGDTLSAEERSASTSNRNFRGRQGKGSRTHLVSPAMAAGAAVTGHFTDVRSMN